MSIRRPDFLQISYLRDGNHRQRQAYQVLLECEIMNTLRDYNPILVGTIPIGIDVQGSDLDIILECYDHDSLSKRVEGCYGRYNNYCSRLIDGSAGTALVVDFEYGDFKIELYGQALPSCVQDAYRHMIIEYQLLEKLGKCFRKQVVSLKNQGIKTEPAFAKLLGIEGDPYEGLLGLDIDKVSFD